ncbi:MAG: hypothetical protein PHV74_13655 [Dehalococcoidia bacterium]|nr:hypothetical protein [Dehalococcoidia bacterium]
MNKRKLSAIVLTLILLIGILAACDSDDDQNSGTTAESFPTTIDDLIFSDIWPLLQQAIPVQEDTALVSSFHLYVRADRTISALDLCYSGIGVDHKYHEYRAHLRPGGVIEWYRYPHEFSRDQARGIYPRDLFADLDTFGACNLDTGEEGASLSIYPVYDIRYSRNSHNLYLMQENELIPLEHINFKIDTSHTSIMFDHRDLAANSDEMTIEDVLPGRQEGITTDIWFLARDLEKISSIGYADDPPCTAPIPDIGPPVDQGRSKQGIAVLYQSADIEAVQALINQGESLYRRDDPVATALAFLDDSRDILNFGEIDRANASMVWEGEDTTVFVDTEQDDYFVHLQKLGGEGSDRIWCVIEVTIYTKEWNPPAAGNAPVDTTPTCQSGSSSFSPYEIEEIEEVQAFCNNGELSYRRDNPAATALEYLQSEAGLLSGDEVIESKLLWQEENSAALVLVETDNCRYRVMLQKLLKQDSSGAWFGVGYDSHGKEYGAEFGDFRTRDIQQAQQHLPFPIIQPSYLPGSIEPPPWFSGPIHRPEDGSAGEADANPHASLTYIWAESNAIHTSYIRIEESGHLQNMSYLKTKPDWTLLDIDGIEVALLRIPMKDPETIIEAFDISTCWFFWNQGEIGFNAWIDGYNQEEAIKVVESMVSAFEEEF